ncbi:MAG: CPBP family glutamic-type intramembrane protease [Tissierella sp.]|uniref:CPBP family glutamic-type intramembrane protease n=1 Tax=Tissierella sp. TaxID=41274 RepID=UPI003F943582
MKNENKLSIYETNLLFLILALVFISVGGFTQNINLFFGVFVTEVLIIAIPSIWFVKRKDISLKKTFRLNKLGFKNIILIFFITILTYPIAAFCQAIFINIIDIFIPLNPDPLPDIISQIPFLLSLLFIAIIPGICEEIMFRGTILKAYEKLGIKKAIIMSAVLFGMFHFTLINFVGPAVLGIVFGIMVYKTNSIYSSMIAHTLNNSLALVINYFVMKNVDIINDISAQEVNVYPNILEMLISFAILGVFIFILIKIVKVLLGKLRPYDVEGLTEMEVEDSLIQENYILEEQIAFSSYIPLVIVAVMFFIFNFIFILR